jgi:hypothetical protein
MKEEWVTPILAECEAAGVAFLFKQWGGVDKHATGRTLNGKTYDALPTGRVARMPNNQALPQPDGSNGGAKRKS